MRCQSVYLRSALLVTILLAPSAAPAAVTTPYIFHDLGNVGWSAVGRAVSVVNGQVEVVGSGEVTSDDSTMSAWYWTQRTGMVNLGSMLAAEYDNPATSYAITTSAASGVNSSGQVVGAFSDSNDNTYAFLYSGGTSITKLFPVTGTGNLTDNGTFGGMYQVMVGMLPYSQGFVYNVNNTNSFTGVGGFGDSPGNVDAFAVNSSGWLTGDMSTAGQHAALYNGSSWIDIGTLGGSAHGRAIDSNGDVVGDNNTGTKHAWYYSASTGMVDLGIGLVGTGDASFAKGINDHDQIVGYTYNSGAYVSGTTPGSYTFLQSPGVVANLGGWTLTAAWAIDNSGDIVGTGTNSSGSGGAFLLTPALAGDANLDGTVDINDLTIVLANYGQTGMAWAQGEFTGDGTVDINDLTIVLAHYGQSTGSPSAGVAPVPEPATLLLAAAGLVGLLVCTWRKRK
jgi:probable HAF family extracellular repeat protein